MRRHDHRYNKDIGRSLVKIMSNFMQEMWRVRYNVQVSRKHNKMTPKQTKNLNCPINTKWMESEENNSKNDFHILMVPPINSTKLERRKNSNLTYKAESIKNRTHFPACSRRPKHYKTWNIQASISHKHRRKHCEWNTGKTNPVICFERIIYHK